MSITIRVDYNTDLVSVSTQGAKLTSVEFKAFLEAMRSLPEKKWLADKKVWEVTILHLEACVEALTKNGLSYTGNSNG